MVMGHSALPKPLSHFIYVFHMPLFFVVAGYCFKTAYCKAPVKFTKRRVKGLWWPFVKWNLIFILLHNALYALGIYGTSYSTHDHIVAIAKTFGMAGSEQMIGGFWFLAGLFFASLISWIVLWGTKCNLRKISICIAAMLITVILLNMFGNESYIAKKLSEFFRYAIYFLAGFLLKGIHDRHGSSRRRLIAASVTCLLLTGAISVYFPGEVSTPFTWELPLRFIGAMAGVIGVLILSSQIHNQRLKRFLMLCGESTILILVWHFLCFKLLTYILIQAHGLPDTDLLHFPVHKELGKDYWPLYVALGLLIPLGIQVAYNFLKNKFLHLGEKD